MAGQVLRKWNRVVCSLFKFFVCLFPCKSHGPAGRGTAVGPSPSRLFFHDDVSHARVVLWHCVFLQAQKKKKVEV